jgi:phospholipase C
VGTAQASVFFRIDEALEAKAHILMLKMGKATYNQEITGRSPCRNARPRDTLMNRQLLGCCHPFSRKDSAPAGSGPRIRRTQPIQVVESENQLPASAIKKVKHIVVIYQENWSFDSLYGDFPGANGIDDASPESLNQVDRLGTPYSSQLRSNNFIRISSAAPQLRTPPQPIKIRMSAQPKLTVDS